MFRQKNSRFSLHTNELSNLKVIQTEESNQSPRNVFETPVAQKNRFRKHSEKLPTLESSSPYLVLPHIEEKFLSPRHERINLMPDMAFADLFKNPIYYEKNGLSPKGSEEILRWRMKNRKVDFSKMVDVVDESNHTIRKDTLNDEKHFHHHMFVRKQTHRYTQSNAPELTQKE